MDFRVLGEEVAKVLEATKHDDLQLIHLADCLPSPQFLHSIYEIEIKML
jgi:hypothetical protein